MSIPPRQDRAKRIRELEDRLAIIRAAVDQAFPEAELDADQEFVTFPIDVWTGLVFAALPDDARIWTRLVETRQKLEEIELEGDE